MADGKLDLKDGISKVQLKKILGNCRTGNFECTVRNEQLVRCDLTTVELGYNVMKGTEYFVSL